MQTATTAPCPTCGETPPEGKVYCARACYHARPGRAAECHPDEPHFKAGLCRACHNKKRRDSHYDPDAPRATCHPDKPAGDLGLCRSCNQKRLRRNNPEKTKANTRRALLKKNYGLTPGQVAEKEAEQGGVCYICQLPPAGRGRWGRLVVDHRHKTGYVRNLLCSKCNTALGLFEENAYRMNRAISYLVVHRHDEAKELGEL